MVMLPLVTTPATRSIAGAVCRLNLDSIADTFLHTFQLARQGFHIPAYFFVGNTGIYLHGFYVRMPEYTGYAVR